MKKLLAFIFSGVILLTGCAKDQNSQNAAESSEQVTVSFTTSLSQDTKAVIDNDGKAAHADQCRLQVIMKNGTTETLVYDKTKSVNTTTHQATFDDVLLVKNQTYDFMFWADNAAGAYYTATDLRTVTINGEYVGCADARDAFFASIKDKEVTEAFSQTVTLKRPFAQLNIITTDIPEIKAQLPTDTELSYVVPNKVALTFTAPDTFNVLTGEASGSRNFTYEAAVYTNPYKQDAGKKNTLSMDYIYASDQRTVNTIGFTAKNDSPTSSMVDISTTFENIPLQRNYRTSITGKLLTNTATFEIEILPGWDGVTTVDK